MHAQRWMVVAGAAVLSSGGMVARGQQNRLSPKSPDQDRPQVAIIQYESGRTLLIRKVNGQMQVVEMEDRDARTLQSFLTSTSLDTQLAAQDQDSAPAAAAPPIEPADPATNGFYWPDAHAFVNTNEPAGASRVGRATGRMEQRAAEARQQVLARRAENEEQGLTNLAGRVFPLTAAEQEQRDRLAGARSSASTGGQGDPAMSFYSLGYGLEDYRQQDLASRKELALLSYDVLLREGLQFFSDRQYGQAARSFIGAAMKDQGDAASRLHAAQALLASGLYSQALAHVTRAFELAPGLMNRPLNHRANYAHPEDFDAHLAALEAYVAEHAEDTSALVLLGYEKFFSSDPAAARDVLVKVKRQAGGMPFARKLLVASEPLVGRL
jgi:hypothetical protein